MRREQWNRVTRALFLLQVALVCCWCARAELLPTSGGDKSRGQFEIWHSEADWQQNHISAIVQSRDGYLWLGTYVGLIRYDGVQCKVFDSANSPGLVNGLITSLYEDEQGTLWIGHKTGDVTRFINGRFEPAGLNPAWPKGVIETITSDERGDVWVLSGNRFLFRLRDGLCLAVPGEASTTRQVTLTRARDGKLWLVSNGILARIQQDKVVALHLANEAQAEVFDRVYSARDGGIWILGNNRLRKWREGRWVDELRAEPALLQSINVLLETSAGAVLAGTFKEGLYLFNAGASSPIHFGHTNGLSHDGVRALLEDREGNLWIGTHAGLDRLRRRKVQMLCAPDNWQGCVVLSFAVRPDGTVWVGTEGAGLYRFDGAHWTNFGLPNQFVWSVLMTRAEELFVGTWGGGLLARNGSSFESPGELSRIAEPIAALYEGRRGDLWIGTGAGLHHYEGGKLTWFGGPEKLVQPDVRTIAEAPDGTVWFGMLGGGLGAWQQGRLKQYRKQDGLGSDFVVSLYADADGTLWIGSSDNGLTRLKQGQFATISAEHGLPNNSVSHIVDDQAGHLWLGLQQGGIARVSKSDLHRCADGVVSSVRCIGYGRAEGLGSSAFSGGFHPGACRAPDGRLWFPTLKGLAIIDPSEVATNSVPPPVLIEEMLVDGQPVPLRREGGQAASVRIAPGRHRFEFRYTGLSFVESEQVRFKYKLDRLEPAWREAGTKRLVEFNGLEPGSYEFQVVACNNAGLWNPSGASLAFTVLPHFWQTLWFKVLASLGLLGGVGGVARYVTKKKLQKKLAALQLQHALDKERSRIAQDMHDDIGSRLTEILLVGDQAQKSPADRVKHIERMANVTREVVEHLDELVWAINPRNDSLDKVAAYLYDYAQNFLETASIRGRFEIPTRFPDCPLSSELRHNLFMVVKEALNNIVKHARCSEVQMQFQVVAEVFSITITDNGKGFCPSAGAASGDGLGNMARRITSMGGRFDLKSAPGQGTCVSLHIQLPPFTDSKV